MKKTLNKLLIIVISLFFIQCNSISKKSKVQILNLNFDTLANINLDSQFFNISSFYQPFGSNYLYFLNANDNSLYKLDLENYKINKHLKIPDTLSFESIYIDESNKNNYLLFSNYLFCFNNNSSLKFKKKIPDHNYGYLTVLNSNFTPIVNNNVIYFHFFSNISDKTFQSDIFFKQPIEAGWNLINDSISILKKSAYPSNYKKFCYGYFYAPDRIELPNNKHGYTFSYNDSLYIYDLENESISSYFFGTYRSFELINIPFDSIKFYNSKIFDEMMFKNTSYTYPKYFPISRFYTRELMFCNDSVEKISDIKRSLLIFDEKLNYIGETSFDCKYGNLIDSNNGILTYTIDNEHHTLKIIKLCWNLED